jgi:hypothetical protein
LICSILVTLKEQVYNIVFLVAAIAYFVPALIVVWKKLYKDRVVTLFAIYWTIGGIINVLDKVPGLNSAARDLLTVGYNLIDIPFVLLIFYFTTTSAVLKKFILISGSGYIAIEVIHCIVKGMGYLDLGYVIGIGTLLALIVIGWEIVRYFSRMEHSNREKAMIFIYAAMMFEYGSYVIVYIFEYYFNGNPNIDTLLIYYFSALIGVGIASIGFLSKDLNENQRKPQVAVERFRITIID